MCLCAENISGQVVDCLAHDGLGDTSQSLIDPSGCPVDEVLVPKLLESRQLSRTLGDYRFTVLATSFPAFKFPDRESVHVRCGLQLCRGSCQQVRVQHAQKIRPFLKYLCTYNSTFMFYIN